MSDNNMHPNQKIKNLLDEVLQFINKLKAQPLPSLEISGLSSEEIRNHLEGTFISLDKISRFFEFVPILDQIKRLNSDYPLAESLVESGEYSDAFQLISPLLTDFQHALALTLPEIKDEGPRLSLIKFVASLYSPVYLLAGICSGLSGNLNFVLSNFEKCVDLLLLFSSKRNHVEAQYLLARAMTALQHIPQGITCFRNTLRLAEEHQFPWLQIKCLISMSDAYFDVNNNDAGEQILDNAIERAGDMQKELIDLLSSYGDERYRLGDSEKASIYFGKAVDVAFALQDLDLISKTLTKLDLSFIVTGASQSPVDDLIDKAIELAEKTNRREFVVHFKLLKEKRKIPQMPFAYSFDTYTEINELPDDLKAWMVFSRTHILENHALIICWNGKVGSNLALYGTQDRLKELLALESLKMIKLDEGEYMIKDAPDNLKKEYRIHALIHPETDAKISVKTEQETFVISL